MRVCYAVNLGRMGTETWLEENAGQWFLNGTELSQQQIEYLAGVYRLLFEVTAASVSSVPAGFQADCREILTHRLLQMLNTYVDENGELKSCIAFYPDGALHFDGNGELDYAVGGELFRGVKAQVIAFYQQIAAMVLAANTAAMGDAATGVALYDAWVQCAKPMVVA